MFASSEPLHTDKKAPNDDYENFARVLSLVDGYDDLCHMVVVQLCDRHVLVPAHTVNEKDLKITKRYELDDDEAEAFRAPFVRDLEQVVAPGAGAASSSSSSAGATDPPPNGPARRTEERSNALPRSAQLAMHNERCLGVICRNPNGSDLYLPFRTPVNMTGSEVAVVHDLHPYFSADLLALAVMHGMPDQSGVTCLKCKGDAAWYKIMIQTANALRTDRTPVSQATDHSSYVSKLAAAFTKAAAKSKKPSKVAPVNGVTKAPLFPRDLPYERIIWPALHLDLGRVNSAVQRMYAELMELDGQNPKAAKELVKLGETITELAELVHDEFDVVREVVGDVTKVDPLVPVAVNTIVTVDESGAFKSTQRGIMAANATAVVATQAAKAAQAAAAQLVKDAATEAQRAAAAAAAAQAEKDAKDAAALTAKVVGAQKAKARAKKAKAKAKAGASTGPAEEEGEEEDEAASWSPSALFEMIDAECTALGEKASAAEAEAAEAEAAMAAEGVEEAEKTTATGGKRKARAMAAAAKTFEKDQWGRRRDIKGIKDRAELCREDVEELRKAKEEITHLMLALEKAEGEFNRKTKTGAGDESGGGVLVAALKAALAKHNISVQRYWNGTLVGPDCRKLLQNYESVLAALSQAIQGSTSGWGAVEAERFVYRHTAVLKPLATISHLTRAPRKLTDVEIDKLRDACAEFGRARRAHFPDSPLTPKEHVTERDMMEQVERYRTIGWFGEDGLEALHPYDTRKRQLVAAVRNPEARHRAHERLTEMSRRTGEVKREVRPRPGGEGKRQKTAEAELEKAP